MTGFLGEFAVGATLYTAPGGDRCGGQHRTSANIFAKDRGNERGTDFGDVPGMTKKVAPGFKVVSWTILGALALGGCGNADPEVSDREAEAQQSAVFQDGVSPSGYAGTRDTFLREETPSQNNGDATPLRVDGDSTNGKDLSALLRFELSSIPRDAIVRSVKLTVDVENATAGAAYEIYALKRSWGENTATWTSAATGSAWALAGAKSSTDRDWTALGSVAATSTGKITITLNAAGIVRVQQWIASPATNYGLVISDGKNGDGLAFASRESSTASSRPKLAVTYDRPSTDAGTDTGVNDTGVSDTGGAADADASTCVAQFPGDPRCANKMYYGAAVEGGDPSTLEAKVGRKIAIYRSFWGGDDAASKLVTRATTDLANDRSSRRSCPGPGRRSPRARTMPGCSSAFGLSRPSRGPCSSRCTTSRAATDRRPIG